AAAAAGRAHGGLPAARGRIAEGGAAAAAALPQRAILPVLPGVADEAVFRQVPPHLAAQPVRAVHTVHTVLADCAIPLALLAEPGGSARQAERQAGLTVLRDPLAAGAAGAAD